MTFYVTNQNNVVLWLFIIGAIIGVIYDIFKVKREIFGKKLIIYIVDDLLFSLLYTTILVFAIFLTNYGYVRWYEIVAALFGFFLYKVTVSNLFVRAATLIIRFILKILKAIIAFLLKPVTVILSFTVMCIKRICSLIFRKYQVKKAKNNSKKKLKRELILSRKGFYKT